MTGNGPLTFATAGFRYTPATLDCIRAWLRGGRAVPWIARQLQWPPDTLRTICAEHGIALRPEPAIAASADPPMRAPDLPPEPRLDAVRRRSRLDLRGITMAVTRETIAALEREAARRSTNATTLAAVILETIAGDALFVAILDH